MVDRLSALAGFAALTDEQQQELIRSATTMRRSMGEPVLLAEERPAQLLLLLEGQLRQLVPNPAKPGSTITLALLDPGYPAGWPSWQAGQGLELLTAASDVQLLALDPLQWKALLKRHPALALVIQQQVWPAELWALSEAAALPLRPGDPRDWRSWMRRLCASTSVRIIHPGSPSHEPLDPQRRWLVSAAGLPELNLPLGTALQPEQLPALQDQLPSHQTLRLLGLPELLWRDPAHHLQLPLNSPSEVITGLSLPAGPDNRTKTAPEPEEEPDPTAMPFFSAPEGVVPEALACFRMLARRLNLPIKPDLVQRILEEQTNQGERPVTLQLAAAVAEYLGLQTQILPLPAQLLSRLQFPCLLQLPDQELVVAYGVRDDQLLLARPRQAMEWWGQQQLQPCLDAEGVLPVLLLRVTDSTPQKKFGLSWFLPAIRRHRRQLIEVLIASLFVQLFQLMNPLIIQQIVDKVIGQNGMSSLPVLAVLLVSFSIFENVLTAVRTNLFIETTNRIDLSLGEQVIDHLLRLPLNYFDHRPVGELSSRLAELENIRSFMTGTALTVVLDSVFSVIYIAVMLAYSWLLTIVALLIAPVLALITLMVSPVVRSQLRAKAQLNARTQNHLVEVLTGIQTVKAQNFELKARWRWKERYSEYVAQGFRNAVTATASNGFTQFLNQFSSLAVLCVGAYLVLQGQLTLGGLIAFRIFAGYVTTPLLRLSNLWQSFQQTGLSLERLSDIIDTPQESSDSDRTNIPLPLLLGRITYEDVSFRFGKEGPLQLSQVSLEVPEGEFVAIVGQSGSGKSTLTKLLPRLYPPISGRIFVDGYDIAKVELYSLRRQIGIVPQDSLLFEGSVQDNIALSNPEATSDQIIAAAKVACAHDFIMGLPLGYNSPVGERGSSLSGGQRQRIAIARTVLQDPRLLIMDEATSALDYATERLVSLNLMDHFRGRTVLFITHRLNSIRHADRILLMHEGSLAEQGSHDQLMALQGRYYALFRQQEASAS